MKAIVKKMNVGSIWFAAVLSAALTFGCGLTAGSSENYTMMLMALLCSSFYVGLMRMSASSDAVGTSFIMLFFAVYVMYGVKIAGIEEVLISLIHLGVAGIAGCAGLVVRKVSGFDNEKVAPRGATPNRKQ